MLRSISYLLAALFNNRSRFDRQWKEFQAPAAHEGGLSGRWIGQWVSEVNGHHGELKCILTRIAPGRYDAAWHATFAKVLRVCYKAHLHGRELEGRIELEGEADIGKLAGGIYHYKGAATPSEFKCAYRCAYDHGVFEMKPCQ